MTHLFLFTITPVQSFISQARKTRDLWAGSKLLSDLIKEAILEIYDRRGKVIFPFVDERKGALSYLKNKDSLPNRILAEFHLSDDADFNDIGNAVSNQIDRALNSTVEAALEKIRNQAEDISRIEDSFKQQIKNYFNTFWVFVAAREETYDSDYKQAERLLAAVKNVRPFNQFPERGRKCSLTGQQNALVFNRSRLPGFSRKLNRAVQVNGFDVEDKEGLSAISFVKRIYKGGKGFDSTTEIALLKTLSDAKEKCFDKLRKFRCVFDLQHIVECLENEGGGSINMSDSNDWGNFNDQFYYEENLTAKTIKNSHQLRLAKKYHEKFRNALKNNELSLTKYYAIIMFDADNMGKWLSGEYLISGNLFEFHKHLSGLLSGFADYAKDYVDGNGTHIKKGRTVYAGGDDYLGFINLHYLFKVLKHLRESFDEKVGDQISKTGEFDMEEGKRMSFSAGICIAHYKTPLSEVLKWARRMEKEAKDTDEKDCFGMAVLKHSGEIHKAILKFKKEEEWLTTHMENIIDSLKEKKISRSFITSIEKEMALIADCDRGLLDDDIVDALTHEFTRLINRAKIEAEESDIDLVNRSTTMIFQLANSGKDPLNFRHPIMQFNDALNICDFIKRKITSNE